MDVGGPQGWVYTVQWTWTPPTLYVGDRLRFSWPRNSVLEHNVWCFPNNVTYQTCNFRQMQCELGEQNYVTRPFTRPGWYYYGCEERGHCAAGQKIAVQVLAGELIMRGCEVARFRVRLRTLEGADLWLRNMQESKSSRSLAILPSGGPMCHGFLCALFLQRLLQAVAHPHHLVNPHRLANSLRLGNPRHRPHAHLRQSLKQVLPQPRALCALLLPTQLHQLAEM